MYHKLTYTGPLLNLKSFTLISYKISLNKSLIDRSFKICNNWNSFHNDIESIKFSLIKNAYLPFLKYLNVKFSSNQNQFKDTSDFYYFKLSYIGNLSHHIKNKLSKLCKEFCKEKVNIKGALSGMRQFFATESHLKMMKNIFYFSSKALFFLKIFKVNK